MVPESISLIPAGSAWWAFAAVAAGLALHIGGGSIGILTGYAAVNVKKGERLHRRFGTIYLVSMVTMAVAATILAASILSRSHISPVLVVLQKANVAGGIFAFYLVTTGWVAIKRTGGRTGLFEIIAALSIAGVSVLLARWGVEAQAHPVRGAPAILFFIFAFLAALFAAFDFKVLVRGGVSGASRIARHLWRMCFALFFAAASFFLGQQKVMPAFLHDSPVLVALGVAPLAYLAYWLVRVQFTRQPRAVAAAE